MALTALIGPATKLIGKDAFRCQNVNNKFVSFEHCFKKKAAPMTIGIGACGQIRI